MKILLKILLSVLLFYSNIFCADMESDFSDAFVNPIFLQELGINDHSDDELQDELNDMYDEWQDSDDDLMTPRECLNKLIQDIKFSSNLIRDSLILDLWAMYRDAQKQKFTLLAHACYKALVEFKEISS